MKAKLLKGGNSLALCIPEPAAETAKLCEGDTLDLAVEGPGGVRMHKLLPKPTLEELVARITEKNRHGETDWGEALGNEVW
jgi:antitoxin MazE